MIHLELSPITLKLYRASLRCQSRGGNSCSYVGLSSEYYVIQVNPNTTYLVNGLRFLNTNTTYLLKK